MKQPSRPRLIPEEPGWPDDLAAVHLPLFHLSQSSEEIILPENPGTRG
jgi:hypothetical protein